LVHTQPERVAELVQLLWDADAVVRMRSADALEKLSRDGAGWLEPHKADLLGLMIETRQQEVRWHLAAIVARLELTVEECRRAVEILEKYLEDRSSIVKAFAMQGLWDLAQLDLGLRTRVVDLIQEITFGNTTEFAVTPAMRARGRRLLKDLGSLKKR